MSLNDFEKCAFYLEPYLNKEISKLADSLAFRKDMAAFLLFIKENKVVGTRSTGNMPLKMVAKLANQLVNPPKLEHRTGEKIYKVRSESEVWDIYFSHILAAVGQLARISPGRQWRLTSGGKKFLTLPSLIQLCIVLLIWWHRVNWLVTFPVMGIGENLPRNFEFVVLQHLISIMGKDSIAFDTFAYSIVEESGLTWTSQDKTYHQKFLRDAIERMVIDVHKRFGIIESRYEDEFIGKIKFKKIVSFRMTKLGEPLIEAVKLSFG